MFQLKNPHMKSLQTGKKEAIYFCLIQIILGKMIMVISIGPKTENDMAGLIWMLAKCIGTVYFCTVFVTYGHNLYLICKAKVLNRVARMLTY